MDRTVSTMESGAVESSRSAVSWGPVIAGALVATAVSLCLVFLGSGLGLTAVSPWSGGGVSATTFAVSTAIWLIVMQWVSAGLGGYLTGRLRTKWSGVHTDEVFFRDTAHGFLAWALSTLIVAWVVSSSLGAIIGGGATAASSVVTGAATVATDAVADSNGYMTDMLFRSVPGSASATPTGDAVAAQAEAGRILVTAAASGELSADDKAYLGQIVSAKTGLPQAEAEARVADVMTRIDAAKVKAKEAADAARKSGITLSLFMFVSLLIGAFIASVAAALGGRERDEHEALLIVR